MDKKLHEIICAKDEKNARIATQKLLADCDLKEFEGLCNKMDFLFDFVRENVYNRFKVSINKNNFKNIIKFFEIYSPYFDDFFASILAKYADEDLTDDILEILSTGSDFQKAYASSYFKKIPDTVAVEELIKNLKTEFEPLFLNCAEALGVMNDEISYKENLADLNSDDEFQVLKAVKFFVAYGKKDIFADLFEVMKNSNMPENIAGELSSMISPRELLNEDFPKGILVFNNLLNGLGEILPLENLFFYDVYDVLFDLSKVTPSPMSATILLNAKIKFNILTENDEYIFDLDKETKNEVLKIQKFLASQNEEFWTQQKSSLKSLLKENEPLLLTVLDIVKEMKFDIYADDILALLGTKNETLICEAVSTLKCLGKLDKIDRAKINFKNENLKAIFEQLFQ